MAVWFKTPGCANCGCCLDNGHGYERPHVDPSVFISLPDCPLGDTNLPPWDGWLREKVDLRSTPYCAYVHLAPNMAVFRKLIEATLYFDAVIHKWQFEMDGRDFVGNQATYWRGIMSVVGPANDAGIYPRFTSCPHGNSPPASINITFGVPPP